MRGCPRLQVRYDGTSSAVLLPTQSSGRWPPNGRMKPHLGHRDQCKGAWKPHLGQGSFPSIIVLLSAISHVLRSEGLARGQPLRRVRLARE